MVTAGWPAEQQPGGILVAVAALVADADRVLLVRRAKEPAAGKWSLPGGHVLLGETLADAVRRELREETALIATEVGDLLEVDELVRPTARLHYLIHVYRVHVDASVPPHAGDDAADARWADAADLAELETTFGLREFLARHGVGVPPPS